MSNKTTKILIGTLISLMIVLCAAQAFDVRKYRESYKESLDINRGIVGSSDHLRMIPQGSRYQPEPMEEDQLKRVLEVLSEDKEFLNAVESVNNVLLDEY